MNKKKEEVNNDLNFECEPTDEMEKFKKNEDKSSRGDKKIDTATDIYYKTQCKLPDSKVAIPTFDSVVEAKEWVDDRNKM